MLKVAESFVWKLIRELIESNYNFETVAEKKVHARWSDTIRDDNFVAKVQKMMEKDPRMSIRGLVRQLEKVVLSWSKKQNGDRAFVCLQDCTPCHTSRKSQK